jgi:hypothetical protein
MKYIFDLSEIRLAELLEIRTGGEVLSFATKYENPNAFVFGYTMHQPSYGLPHLGVYGIHLLRASQRDQDNSSSDVQAYELATPNLGFLSLAETIPRVRGRS